MDLHQEENLNVSPVQMPPIQPQMSQNPVKPKFNKLLAAIVVAVLLLLILVVVYYFVSKRSELTLSDQPDVKEDESINQFPNVEQEKDELESLDLGSVDAEIQKLQDDVNQL